MSEPNQPYLVRTERLDLHAVTLDDLDALFALNTDARTWGHQPEGRHTDPETTRAWIERAVAAWDADGLGYWTVRLRATGEVVGSGGAQQHPGGYWNLYYRLSPARWGHGYATELARAAQRHADHAAPELPFIAWIHAHNTASRAVADRLGLHDYGLRPFPKDGTLTHAYADREPLLST
ncbi:GNAT family N-acetyltransferase [Kitasatospora sp. GP82]|uniref:GNAT family N-acetyltransferase n=1 Tax=Kitasatospora sp. GP82 TaxID=3035089 RepID=UPI0024735327|nr:GNAT family N-acetyltransferase [Kitasatospora sp. GP82]MDH6128252.1 RimJ/RimL family protein N-acetyltransferase [Kitasatospora sp. GP82]